MAKLHKVNRSKDKITNPTIMSETQQQQQQGLHLRIDNREQFRDRLSTSIRNIDRDAATTITIETLPVGDFLFEWNGEPVLVIERKTLADYAASIRDGRHREQKRRLYETYGRGRVLFIIEGDMTDDRQYSARFTKVPMDTLVSSIVNTMLRDQMHVFHTASDHETIEFLTLVYKKLAKGIDFIKEDGIGESAEKASADYLFDPTKTIKNTQLTPQRTFQLMLQCIPGISSKVSERIIGVHTSMTDFLSHLQSFNTYDETVAYVETIGPGRKIPRPTAQRLVDYLGIYSAE
jgi:ERCC4-type nuclease